MLGILLLLQRTQVEFPAPPLGNPQLPGTSAPERKLTCESHGKECTAELAQILKRLRDGIKIGTIWSGGGFGGPSNSDSGTVRRGSWGTVVTKGKMNSTVVGTLRHWVNMCGNAVRESGWQQGRGGNLQGG